MGVLQELTALARMRARAGEVGEVVVGPHHTAVRAGRRVGLAATPPGARPDGTVGTVGTEGPGGTDGPGAPPRDRLPGGPLTDLVGLTAAADPLHRAIGLAAVNAVLTPPGTAGPDLDVTGLLPRADVVTITAATLLDGGFTPLMERVPCHALVVMVGPTTPITPLLFDHGVDVLAGAVVTDPQALLRAVTAGHRDAGLPGLRRVLYARDGALVAREAIA